ncbi:MAG TPA: Clp protease N-terminal domain-containing protein [Planctomycetota bacterium]|nr:Clp protease N-terminal domain-containing protein [Planctomycetota bacterium]
MFDRFTDRARKSMSFARQNAERLDHDYIGTEHMLMGTLQEGTGTAANALENLEIDIEKLRASLESAVKKGDKPITIGQLPFTPRAKKSLEYAIDEARVLEHNYVGTEHLILGLLREDQGIAAQEMKGAGLTLEKLRAAIREFLHVEPRAPAIAAETGKTAAQRALLRGWTMFLHAAVDEEMKTLGSTNPGSEHFLLALLHDPECLAARLLKKHGLEIDALRAEIRQMLKEGK